MADKKIQIKTFSGDNAFPVTKLENITMTAGPGLQVSGNTIGCAIAVAGTTATATAGVVKPNSTYFSTDANGFLTPKTATTSALGVCKFSSTYFTVSSGSVSPKVASTSHGQPKRLVYSNFAKRRSLSGQRAFSQGGKHRPNPTPDVTAVKTARKGQNARSQN